jgi:hypothetical protein
MPTKTEIAEGIAAGAVLALGGLLLARQLAGKTDQPAVSAPPPPVDLTFATSVADVVAATRNLNRADQVDRHVYFFLYRRARDLGLADASLRTGTGLATLRHRITLEAAIVTQFLDALIGSERNRGLLYGGPRPPEDAADPSRRLDLGEAIRSRDTDPPATTEAHAVGASNPTTSDAATLRELELRRQRVAGIAWRAAAIEGALWKGTNAAPSLLTRELQLLLDRRLRTLERLRYAVSVGAEPDHTGPTSIDRMWDDGNMTPRSGRWLDGFFNRPFEAPSISRKAASDDRSWSIDEMFATHARILQSLSFSDDATGGTFTLEFEGDITAPIAFNAEAHDVFLALQALPSLARHSVRVGLGPLPTAQMNVIVTGLLPVGLQLLVNSSALTGLASPVAQLTRAFRVLDIEDRARTRFNVSNGLPHFPWYRDYATDEFDWNDAPGKIPSGNWKRSGQYAWVVEPQLDRQVLSLTGNPTGGSFSLVYDGQTSRDLWFDADPQTMTAALSSFPDGAMEFECQGGPLSTAPLVIKFRTPQSLGKAFSVGSVNLTGGVNPQLVLSPRISIGSASPAMAIRELFQPLIPLPAGEFLSRRDFWNRTWLRADAIMSALHLEGLCSALALNVQPPGRPDDEFNAIPQTYALALDDYFQVRRWPLAPAAIMMPGRTDYFENATIPKDDLQPGDQVMFETPPVLVAAGRAAREYPTVLVTDVDSSREKPDVHLANLEVQGFGTTSHSQSSFQALLAKEADRVLDGMRSYIHFEFARERALAAEQNVPFVPPTRLSWDIGALTVPEIMETDAMVLRHWSPYDDQWDEPGPWWLRIYPPAKRWEGVFGADTLEILNRMPRAMVWIDPSHVRFSLAGREGNWRPPGASPVIPVAPGFRAPPTDDAILTNADPHKSIFFPLFQPFGGWEMYFEGRMRGDTGRGSPEPVKMDAAWRASLARDPADPTRVRVIRPRPKFTI